MSFRIKNILEELNAEVSFKKVIIDKEDQRIAEKYTEEIINQIMEDNLGKDYDLYKNEIRVCNGSSDARCIFIRFYNDKDYENLVMYRKALVDIKRNISRITIVLYTLQYL